MPGMVLETLLQYVLEKGPQFGGNKIKPASFPQLILTTRTGKKIYGEKTSIKEKISRVSKGFIFACFCKTPAIKLINISFQN